MNDSSDIHAESVISDKRRTYTFYVDDAIIDTYGARIGVYGVAVYAYLSRRSKNHKSFPAIRRIAKDLAMSAAKVQLTLKQLSDENLIAISNRSATTNIYEILDLSHLRDVPPHGTDVYHHTVHDVPPHGTKGVLFENYSIKEAQFKEEEPPIPPAGDSPQQRPRGKTPPSRDSLAVIAHLNAVHGRTYRNTTQIDRLLHTGVSLEDCLLVIDFGFAVLRIERTEWYVQYFDNVTPFRPANFDKYLARAKEWQQKRSGAQTDTRQRMRVVL